MFKNVAAKFIVFAFDSTTNLPKSGDAANITAYVGKDYGAATVLADTSATEIDATNAKGYYLFDAAQGETNGDILNVTAKSSTANIVVVGAPAIIYTRPTTGWLAPATAGRTLVVDAAGLADANMVKLGPTGSGTAQTARDVGASVIAASVSGNVGGNVVGSVGSVTGLTASNLDATISSRGSATNLAIVAGYIDTEITDIQNRLPAALVSGRMDSSIGSTQAGQGPPLRKNTAHANFKFRMTDATTHAPKPSVPDVEVTVCRGGGAFGALSVTTVTEISSGFYRCDFSAADLNDNNVAVRITGTDCDDIGFTVATNP